MVVVPVDTLLRMNPVPVPGETAYAPGPAQNVWFWPAPSGAPIEFFKSRVPVGTHNWLDSLRLNFNSILLDCPAPVSYTHLDVYKRQEYSLRAQQMGASGYICKNASRADLLRAFKSVLAGKKYFDDQLSAGTGGKTVPKHADLSTREYRVMLAFAAGERASEIAGELNLSVKTISTYKRRLLDKLELHSTADLVRYVIDNRLS